MSRSSCCCGAGSAGDDGRLGSGFGMSESCPKCGASDWKTVTQNSQSVYKACGNCNYSPWLERAETQNATEWLERINNEYKDAKHELFVRQEEVSATEKPTTLMHGRLNKATRIF